MEFTNQELEWLRKNDIYKQISNTDISTLTSDTLETYKAGIQKTTIEVLPLIKYINLLLQLQNAGYLSDAEALLTTIDGDTGNVSLFQQNIQKMMYYMGGSRQPSSLSGYSTHYGSGTLNAGSVTFDLLAAQAGDTWSIYKFWFYTENTTTPLSCLYDFLIQTKTTNTKLLDIVGISQQEQGRPFIILKTSADAGEAIEVVCDETTGAGDQIVTVGVQAGYL